VTGRELLDVVQAQLEHRGMMDREIEKADLMAFAMGTLLPAINRAIDMHRAKKANRSQTGT
jgi:hypothetical protein